MTRIALISDIHFGRLARSTEFSVPGEPIQDECTGGESLKSSLISTLKKDDIQYICVAGDLTSRGSPQEFKFCEDLILSIADEVGIPHDRVIIGLGNHDIDWAIADLYKNYNCTDAAFPKDLVIDRYRRIAANAATINIEALQAPPDLGPEPFSGIVANDDFIMFVLNSGCYCTQDQQFSHGKLSDEQIHWFNSKAQEYKADMRWKIVLIHHHPFAYKYPVPGIDISMIEEAGEFIEIAGKNGINLVLHGHRHHPKAETAIKTDWIHPMSFVCAGSLSVNSSHRGGGSIPNTLHTIELTDEVGVLKLYSYQYSPAEGWIPIVRNSPVTPIDATMMLGKIFQAEDVANAISTLPEDTVLSWDTLDDRLRFHPLGTLNEELRTQLSDTHKVVGHFPEEVILIKKGG